MHALAAAGAKIEEDMLILDTHVDIPVTLGTAAADPGQDGPMQVDIPKMRRGGVNAAFLIAYVKQGELTTEGYDEALVRARDKFDAIERTLRRGAAPWWSLAPKRTRALWRAPSVP